MEALERIFRLHENGTTLRTEALAGATTFATMSYIVVVQPQVLSSTGMDFGAVMVATCVASAVGTLLMGFLANYPIALAPAMGHNFFFATTVCGAAAAGGMGYSWQEALGAVAVAGVVFLVLSILRVREKLIDAIPVGLRHAIGAGIGMLIALVGLHDAGLAVPGQGKLMTLGDLSEPTAVVALVGLAVTSVLMARRVPGAILLGMAASATLCYTTGLASPPSSALGLPPSVRPTLGQLRVPDILARPETIMVILTFLYLDMFDTVGTLIGVAQQAGFMREGKLPRAGQALAADAASTVIGAVAGTSTVTSYVESAAGVASGGRTGLANVVTAALFLLALFAAPLVRALGGGIVLADGTVVHPVTAPALVIVGAMMMNGARHIDWASDGVPAFLTVLVMVVDLNISAGISVGFLSYVLLKVAQGQWRQIHGLTYACAAFGTLYFAFLR